MRLQTAVGIACLVLVSFTASGCGSLGFSLSQDIPEQRVAGAAVNPLVGLLPGFLQAPVPINIDLRTETQKRNTGPAVHAYLSALSLSITPHDQPATNFDFLDQVHIFIEAQQSTGLPRREIATLNPVPKGKTTVDFATTADLDLLPYIKAQDSDPKARAQMTAEARGTQPKNDVTYDGKIVIEIKI